MFKITLLNSIKTLNEYAKHCIIVYDEEYIYFNKANFNQITKVKNRSFNLNMQRIN